MENLHSIAEAKSYEIVEKITEGCSGDEKYKLRKDGKYFLLRISDKAKTSEKRKEYEQLAGYMHTDIHTHKPILFGTNADIVYSIVSWVDGIPIMDIIKKDTSKNYYELGKKVGRELRKLHSCYTDIPKADWQDIVEKRALRFLDNYHQRKVVFRGE